MGWEPEVLFQSPWTDFTFASAWTNLNCILLFVSPILFLYCLYKILRVPNKVERRIRRFTSVVMANPVISHRGGYPENTLAGIRLAKKKGFRAVELDLEFTKDCFPVLLHDPTVDRTSNGTGHIRDLTFAQVREMDFGIKFGSEYAGEKIPTLQEAIALCKELDLIVIIDIKSNRRLVSSVTLRPLNGELFIARLDVSTASQCILITVDKSAKLINEICCKDPELYDYIAVISFYPDMLYLVSRTNPNIVVAAAMKDWEFTYNMDGTLRHDQWWRQALAPFFDVIISFLNHQIIWRLTTLPFVGIFRGDLNDKKLEFWRKRGATVIVWTMAENEAQDFQKKFSVPVMVDIKP